MLTLGATLAERILAFPAPVAVSCTGHAFPAGAFLLMAADTRIGVDGPFKLGLNEVRIGLTLPWFAIVLARHRLTPAHFDHATVTGTMFDPHGSAGGRAPRRRGRIPTSSTPLPLSAAEDLAAVDRTRACRHQAPGAPARPRGAAIGHRCRAGVITLLVAAAQLDTRRHPAHDQRRGIPRHCSRPWSASPRTLLRLPASTLRALDAVERPLGEVGPPHAAPRADRRWHEPGGTAASISPRSGSPPPSPGSRRRWPPWTRSLPSLSESASVLRASPRV